MTILTCHVSSRGFYSTRIKPWSGSVLKAQQNWAWVAPAKKNPIELKCKGAVKLQKCQSNTHNFWHTLRSHVLRGIKKRSVRTTVLHALCDCTCLPHTIQSFSMRTVWPRPPSSAKDLPKMCWELSFPVLWEEESWIWRMYNSNSCQRGVMGQVTDVDDNTQRATLWRSHEAAAFQE